MTTPTPALGAAIYFDTDLVANPAPFGALLDSVFGEGVSLTQWTLNLRNRSSGSRPYRRQTLVDAIASGNTIAVGAGTPPRTPDADEAHLSADTKAKPRAEHASRHAIDADFGAHVVARIGAARIVDALVTFARAVSATAGVVFWAETTVFAASLATCVGTNQITRAQDRRVADQFYRKRHWGRLARGPAWGTFLSAEHVERLGGLGRLERDGGCARIASLSGGSVFLQLTRIDDPIIEEHDDPRLVALAQVLEPVLADALARS